MQCPANTVNFLYFISTLNNSVQNGIILVGRNHRAEAGLALHSQGLIPLILNFWHRDHKCIVQPQDITLNVRNIILGSMGCLRIGWNQRTTWAKKNVSEVAKSYIQCRKSQVLVYDIVPVTLEKVQEKEGMETRESQISFIIDPFNVYDQ